MDNNLLNRLKEEIVAASNLLIRTGVISLSLHGNFSARVPDSETFLLTGGGSIADLKPENIALFHMDGTLLQGAVQPSGAEVVDMHSIVYQLRPDMGAVVHTHSPQATTYAVANKPMPVIYEALVRFNMTDGVPVAAYGPRGSKESVDNIAEAIKGHPNIGGVLLANHGVLAFGPNAHGAAHANILIEETAVLGIQAEALGGALLIPKEMFDYTQQRRDEFAAKGTKEA
ncbi:MAG: class II aldolase/adducin family protein [Chloroflexota bacterium]